MNKALVADRQSIAVTVVRYLLGFVLGYAAMIVLLFVAQNLFFGGISYYRSPSSHLVIGGILSVFAAVAGGVVAALVSSAPRFLAGSVISFLVVIETVYMTSAGRMEGPLWFDYAASFSLVIGIFAGYLLVAKFLVVRK